MPRAPRGKRIVDVDTGSFIVAGRAPNGQAAPYFDKSRNVWVAPWTKPDGKIGRPTGRTRSLAEASRDRDIAEAAELAKYGRLKDGFHAESTLTELMNWWLERIARHRVRGTTFATYRKQLKQVEDRIGGLVVRTLRPEQLTTLMSDLVDAGTVVLRRGATYEDGVGMVLGPTKTAGAAGRQPLSPTVIERLRRRQAEQDEFRQELPGAWPSIVYRGERLDLIFTNSDGSMILRQHVDRAIRQAAVKAGLDPADLGTHTGRRSVVTNLYASGSLDLADVATTRGYVQHEGERPRQVSQRAFQLLDPAAS
jgi:hypothetical protein